MNTLPHIFICKMWEGMLGASIGMFSIFVGGGFLTLFKVSTVACLGSVF